MNSVASRNAASQPFLPVAPGRDLLVGVLEQRLELIAGERAPRRIGLGVLGLDHAVPLVNDLHRVGTEPPYARWRLSIRGSSTAVGHAPPTGPEELVDQLRAALDFDERIAQRLIAAARNGGSSVG